MERHGATINRVTSSFGPSPTFKVEKSDASFAESAARFHFDQLQERRQWQDRRLVALAKLKHLGLMNAIKSDSL